MSNLRAIDAPRVTLEFAEEADEQRVTDFLRKWTARFREKEQAEQKDTDAAA